MASALTERFDGEVPTRREDLVTLPGVGRKTANVIRSVAFGLPGLPVDTHVGRLAIRLGLTTETDPVKVELALDKLVPAVERGAFSLRLILHGRKTCVARTPRCTTCILSDFCPSSTAPTSEDRQQNGQQDSKEASQKNGRAGPLKAAEVTKVRCDTVIAWSSSDQSRCRRRWLMPYRRQRMRTACPSRVGCLAAEHQLHVREGLRGVASWEERAGELTPEEIEAGEALLARLLSGVAAKVRPGVAAMVRPVGAAAKGRRR